MKTKIVYGNCIELTYYPREKKSIYKVFFMHTFPVAMIVQDGDYMHKRFYKTATESLSEKTVEKINNWFLDNGCTDSKAPLFTTEEDICHCCNSE